MTEILSKIDRRTFLALATTGAAIAMGATPALAQVRRLVFVHGRSQQGRDPVELQATWLEAFGKGAEAVGRPAPDDLEVAFPFYGDTLDEITRQFAVPLTSDIHARGSAVQDEYLAFQALVAEDIRQKAGVTDEQVDEEYGINPRPRGPLNGEWVQAIIRAVDTAAG